MSFSAVTFSPLPISSLYSKHYELFSKKKNKQVKKPIPFYIPHKTQLPPLPRYRKPNSFPKGFSRPLPSSYEELITIITKLKELYNKDQILIPLDQILSPLNQSTRISLLQQLNRQGLDSISAHVLEWIEYNTNQSLRIDSLLKSFDISEKSN